jgi:hypothetical protein
MEGVLPISSELLLSEIQTALAVLAKWKERVEAGIPGVDLPADEASTYRFVSELCGEILVVAGKCQNVAAILTDRSVVGG